MLPVWGKYLQGSIAERARTATLRFMTKNQKLRVAIIGASGYTGAELARLLANHPHAEMTLATASGERAGTTVIRLISLAAQHLRRDLRRI